VSFVKRILVGSVNKFILQTLYKGIMTVYVTDDYTGVSKCQRLPTGMRGHVIFAYGDPPGKGFVVSRFEIVVVREAWYCYNDVSGHCLFLFHLLHFIFSDKPL
jgi:hypothetical protein